MSYILSISDCENWENEKSRATCSMAVGRDALEIFLQWYWQRSVVTAQLPLKRLLQLSFQISKLRCIWHVTSDALVLAYLQRDAQTAAFISENVATYVSEPSVSVLIHDVQTELSHTLRTTYLRGGYCKLYYTSDDLIADVVELQFEHIQVACAIVDGVAHTHNTADGMQIVRHAFAYAFSFVVGTSQEKKRVYGNLFGAILGTSCATGFDYVYTYPIRTEMIPCYHMKHVLGILATMSRSWADKQATSAFEKSVVCDLTKFRVLCREPYRPMLLACACILQRWRRWKWVMSSPERLFLILCGIDKVDMLKMENVLASVTGEVFFM